MIPEASMKSELELRAYLSIVLNEVLKASLDSKGVSGSRVKVCVDLRQGEETLRLHRGRNKVFLTWDVLCGLSSFHKQREPIQAMGCSSVGWDLMIFLWAAL